MVMEMSKTYQYRKVMKPLLERKRRARINKCLDDLKDIMVECLQQEGEHVTRLEKADILELTVEHMRKLKQRGQLSLQSQTSAHVESFRSGYVHAADQISQVLLRQHETDDVGAKIMKFLSTRLIEMQNQLMRSSTASFFSLQMPTAKPNYEGGATACAPTTPLAFYNTSDPKCKQFASTGKEYELIDVTTVDNYSSSRDTASVASVDSNSSEPMWRPW